jgi:enoyl-[acyl-carrier protein] reductase I
MMSNQLNRISGNLLEGKKALILGVANERSIAWGVAKAMAAHGSKVALTYANDKLKEKVIPLAQTIGADFTCNVDVQNDGDLLALKERVEKEWGKFDILVHSLAFANSDDLKGRFIDTSRAGFMLACDVSAYSLIALCQSLQGSMNANGSVMAMSYYGAQKVVQNYNVMGVAKAALEASIRYLAVDMGESGIRVNGISAGPIRTLAASGVAGLRGLIKQVEEKAPLKRNVGPEDVGNMGVYLASDLSTNVTGQVLFVDSGFSILSGM